MHIRQSLLLLFVFLVACQSSSLKESGTNKNNKHSFRLRSNIEEFLSNNQVKSNVVTIQVFSNNDSSKFVLIDDYPDLEAAKFWGYTIIENHEICIVGDSIPNGFIDLEFRNIPDDVMSYNNKIKSSKNLEIVNSHPFIQSVCFKGVDLIECPTPH